MMDDRPGEGDAFPDFSLTVPDGGTITRADLAGAPAVLSFYPKDDTPGCTSENRDFSALKSQFDKAGVALLGVSKDPPAKHAKFIAKHDLTAPLASDAEENGLSDTLGIWLLKRMYGREYMGMERTTYLLDAGGRIMRVWRKVMVKGHAEEVLEAARGLTA